MRYRRMDAQGETLFGHGLDDYATGAEAVALAVRGRLLLLRGEWWEERDAGFPLFEEVLGRRMTDKNQYAISDLIRARILSTQDVTGVESIEFYPKGRMLHVSCVIHTKYGNAPVEVEY